MPKHVKRRMLLSILAAMLLPLLAFTGQSIASPSTQNETNRNELTEQPPAVVNCFGDPMFNNEGEPIRYNYDKPCPEEKPTAQPEASLQSTLEDPVLSALGYDRFADPVVALTGDWPESLTTIRTENGIEFFAAHSTYADAATARLLSRHRLVDPLDFSKGYTKTHQLTLAGEPDSVMAIKLRTNGDPIVVVNTRQRGTGVNAIHGYNLALETQLNQPVNQRLTIYVEARTVEGDTRVGYGHIVFNANQTSVVFDMAVSNTTDDLWLKIVSTPVGVWPGAVKWQMIDRPQSQLPVQVQFGQPSSMLPAGPTVTSTLVLSTALTQSKAIAIAAFENSGVLLGNRVGYQVVTIPAGVTQLVFTMPVSKNFGDLALQIMSPYPDGITPGETYRQLVDRPDTGTEPEPQPQPSGCPAGGCKVNLPLLMTTGSTRP